MSAGDAASTGLVEHTHLFVGGRWEDPAGTDVIEVVSPHDGQLVGRVPHASTEDVDRAVAAAREAFDHGPWPRMAVEERLEVIGRITKLMGSRAQEFAEIITRQNGSPISWSVTNQVMGAIGHFAVTAQIAAAFPFEEERAGMRGGPLVVRREPVGVVAAIVPWNVPQFTAASKLAPALAAGCTVVLKPSPETPLDACLFAEVAAEAGLPEGVLSVLPADREVSEYLVGHPGIDKVAFTGSVGAGRRVMEVAARNLTRVTLELGGKSAAIVLPDAATEDVVRTVLTGSYLNNGQACVALTRVLLPRGRYDELAARIVEAVAALKVGDPTDPDTQVGPLVSRRQQARNLDYIRIGREEGATLLLGGGVPKGLEDGAYVEPTLFGDVTNSMRIAREEIFGPVVCLLPYDTEDEAVALANDSDFGLSGAVVTADVEHGLEIARRIRTGTFTVNGFTIDLTAPFGGYKNSGIGREFGAAGLTAYLEQKAIALPAA
ncbi:aldehyde dehydrogenase [Streptomyces longispororuber]|uniref:aldehyde dehydrogenase n=1 Tax=Streptomyces longispororuber TaxID=68230 RepID=UPI00210A0EF6|nr:aldehyde dehydrogenase [Streptomyces longispororuber]MCQ4210936.1 aldehyde dehydrogenase [Streptomyces longispororuber]